MASARAAAAVRISLARDSSPELAATQARLRSIRSVSNSATAPIDAASLTAADTDRARAGAARARATGVGHRLAARKHGRPADA